MSAQMMQPLPQNLPSFSEKVVSNRAAGRRDTFDMRIQIFKDIKDHVKNNSKKALNQLKFEQKKTLIKELLLRNLTQHFKHTWRMIQARSFTLSLVRNIFKQYRTFGMPPPAQVAKKLTDPPTDHKKRKSLRIYPDTLFYQLHSNAMLLLVAYIVFVFTLDIGYDFSNQISSLSIVKLLIMLYLVFDLVLRFFTVYTKDSIQVDCLKEIASSYFCSYFFLDLLGSLPFEAVVDIKGSLFMQAFVFCRIVRMLNILASPRHFEQVYSSHLKRVISSSKLLSLYEALTATLLVLHLSSCVLVGLSNISDVNTWYEK